MSTPVSVATSPIILASSSKYRAALLSKFNFPFTTYSPNIDERPRPNELPQDLAVRLANDKATTTAKHFNQAIIIASDQVASYQSSNGMVHILGKPNNVENAFNQLSAFSGKSVQFYTSICVIDTRSDVCLERCERFDVSFRPLSTDVIQRYIDIEKPFDCAGSFKSEGLGIRLFSHMSGSDPNTLIGLPLIALTDILLELGIDPLG